MHPLAVLPVGHGAVGDADLLGELLLREIEPLSKLPDECRDVLFLHGGTSNLLVIDVRGAGSALW